MEKLTPSLEDYLEAIANIDNGDGARLTDIAEAMGIAKPSASKAVATLKEKGLATQEHYGPVNLTEQGRQEAEEVSRKHATIKFFLQGFLGLDEATAEQDACLIEHAVSPKTIESLIDFLASNSVPQKMENTSK
jgi:DtxR family Mn-dependent transcriptional regulator